MAPRVLTALQRTKNRHDEECAAARFGLLRSLADARLRTADEVLRPHEALCFLGAFPNDAAVLAMVEAMLARCMGGGRRIVLRRDRIRSHGLSIHEPRDPAPGSHW